MTNKNTQYHNFLLFWLSQTVSQLGSSMTSFALVIWAYKQTGSAMAVSLLTFFSYLPYIIISIFAGSFVDRHKKKYIMLWSDSIAFLCSACVVFLLLTGHLRIWHIYVVNSITGFMNSFQSPATSAALGIMVPKDQLSRASGMNSLSSSVLSVVTPMSASFVSSFWGLKGVIAIDMISFVFAFYILLFFIHISESPCSASGERQSFWKGSLEGFTFLMRCKGLWYLILSMAMLNLFSNLTYENILPAMILARSGGNDRVLGTVSGILGLGGILGGLYVSAFKLPKDPVKLIYYSAAASFLLGDLLMGLGRNVWVWCAAGIFASAPIPFVNAGQNVIIYDRIPPEYRGRVFAVRNAVQYATIPAAILIGGFLADNVLEPFIRSGSLAAVLLQHVVGTGDGGGMALMFLLTGILGSASSVLWYRNRDIQKLR